MKQRFIDLYNTVFDENGSVKSCDRGTTSELIKAAENLKSGIDFGNSDTGMMFVGNIKTLYKEVVQ